MEKDICWLKQILDENGWENQWEESYCHIFAKSALNQKSTVCLALSTFWKHGLVYKSTEAWFGLQEHDYLSQREERHTISPNKDFKK